MPRRTSRTSRTTAALLVLGLSLSGAAAWGSHRLQQDSERDLLRGRTGEVGLILMQVIDAVPARLKAQGAVLTATGLSPTAYEQAAAADVDAGPGRLSFAWARAAADGSFLVLAARGAGLRRGEVVRGPRAETMRAALRSPELVPGQVQGEQRTLGLALGPPAAPPGTVLYQESQLGPRVSPPRQAGAAPFSDVQVVLYGTPVVDAQQVLVSTTPDLPLRGSVERRRLPVGSGSWLLTVRAERPLTGRFAELAPWFVLAGGGVLTLLVALLLGAAERRRREALERYRSERASTELFQRSLLPRLPDLPGLEVAARYLPSERGQEVGGDWFDVFALPQGSVGIVIGDVMGHDLVAASGMAQLRSALRAFARQERDPGRVLDLLDELVTSLEVAELATAFYGTLSDPSADGSRVLRWSNAGHLPPLLRRDHGRCEVLSEGSGLLIGTPLTVSRSSASVDLPAGATLLLFTDGLVESVDRSLEDAVQAVCAAVDGLAGSAAEDVCEAALATIGSHVRRDDVALLVVRTELPGR